MLIVKELFKICLIFAMSSLLLSCGKISDQQRESNYYTARLNVDLAQGYLQQGDNQRAFAKLVKANNYAPDLPEVHNAFAYYYEQVKEFDKAAKSYHRALQLDKTASGRYLNNYARFLCSRGQYDVADNYFAKALDDPSYTKRGDLYKNRSVCRKEANDEIKAAEYLALSMQYQQQSRGS